jgi:hypothetical protein
MHEWLEALQKSAKSKFPGVPAEELRRAETEAGVPLPGELGDLYTAFNGGSFEGEVVLFPLHGQGEQASVLEKTRKAIVGLPVAGVWRFGVKGVHRHLYTARKSAMEEQGDGGGPLPEWVQALGADDWIYGSWDEEKREMRFYRSLANMLNVLVPPVEHEEFGERTFARAIAAVEGALTELAGGEETEGEEAEVEAPVQELQYEYDEGPRGPKSGKAPKAPAGPKLETPAVIAAERRVKSLPSKPAKKEPAKKEPAEKEPAKKEPAQAEAGLEAPAVIAAERRVKKLTSQPAKKEPAQAEAGLEAPAVIAAERRIENLKAPAKKAAARTATQKAPAKKAAAKKAGTQKAPAKKVAAKKAGTQKAPAKKVAAKKASAKKAPAKKAPAKKAAAKKAPAKKVAAKKAAAKKAPAKKAAARKR